MRTRTVFKGAAIPADLNRSVQAKLRNEGKTMSDAIREGLRLWLEDKTLVSRIFSNIEPLYKYVRAGIINAESMSRIAQIKDFCITDDGKLDIIFEDPRYRPFQKELKKHWWTLLKKAWFKSRR